MILEAIVTTKSADGSINIAPMGPHVDALEVGSTFELRPFTTAQTFKNLSQSNCGVLHVIDDALLLARAAIHEFESQPETEPAVKVDGAVLSDCCRWYEFRTQFIDAKESRATIKCEIVHAGRKRDFFGFNRAKNSVLEAAILATRIDFIPIDEIQSQFEPLKTIVSKTGGPDEHKAFELLDNFVSAHASGAKCNSN